MLIAAAAAFHLSNATSKPPAVSNISLSGGNNSVRSGVVSENHRFDPCRVKRKTGQPKYFMLKPSRHLAFECRRAIAVARQEAMNEGYRDRPGSLPGSPSDKRAAVSADAAPLPPPFVCKRGVGQRDARTHSMSQCIRSIEGFRMHTFSPSTPKSQCSRT
jgi:hypothetical protein